MGPHPPRLGSALRYQSRRHFVSPWPQPPAPPPVRPRPPGASSTAAAFGAGHPPPPGGAASAQETGQIRCHTKPSQGRGLEPLSLRVLWRAFGFYQPQPLGVYRGEGVAGWCFRLAGRQKQLVGPGASSTAAAFGAGCPSSPEGPAPRKPAKSDGPGHTKPSQGRGAWGPYLCGFRGVHLVFAFFLPFGVYRGQGGRGGWLVLSLGWAPEAAGRAGRKP
jgi:hypothetical protein